jgi:hypothetical protein
VRAVAAAHAAGPDETIARHARTILERLDLLDS